MGRARVANSGTPATASWPDSELTVPTIRDHRLTWSTRQDEAVPISAAGLAELDFEPIKKHGVQVWTGAIKSGTQLTNIYSGDPGDGEVLIEEDGGLTFHSDEYSTTVYAWYQAGSTRVTKYLLDLILLEIQAMQRNSGSPIPGVCNGTITIGDCCHIVGPHADGVHDSWSKIPPGVECQAIAVASGTEGDIIGFAISGKLYGLAENFTVNHPVFVSTSGRPTTVALGSVQSPRQRIGTGVADGKMLVNVQLVPEWTP